MTPRISPVAVCPLAGPRSGPRLRACSSVNRRTFSMAMTAWSAKVSQELDLLLREGPEHSVRRMTESAPIATALPHERRGEHGANRHRRAHR